MLKNEYLVAKIGLDTAENEPSKGRAPRGAGGGAGAGVGGGRGAELW